MEPSERSYVKDLSEATKSWKISNHPQPQSLKIDQMRSLKKLKLTCHSQGIMYYLFNGFVIDCFLGGG